MASQADGSIIIDTEIQGDGLETTAKDLEAAVKRMVKSLDSLSKKIQDIASQQSSVFTESAQSAKEAAEEYTKAAQDMNDLNIERWDADIDTEPIEDYEQRVQQLNDQLNQLDQEMVSIEFEEGSVESIQAKLDIIKQKKEAIRDQDLVYDPAFEETYQNLISQTETLDRQMSGSLDGYNSSAKTASESSESLSQGIERLRNKLKELESSGLYFGDDEYDETYLELQSMQQAVKNYKQELSSPADTTTLEGQIQGINRELEQMREAGKTFGDADYDSTYQSLIRAQDALKSYRKELEDTTREADSSTTKLSTSGSKLGSIFRIAFSRLVQGAKNAVKGLNKTERSSNRTRTSVLKLAAAALGFRTLFSAWTAALRGAKEGFTNLAQYSTETNQSISSMMSALTKLKNSLATAFNPILTVIAPIITKFVNMLATAVTYVGMFFAALAGQSTFTKAKGVQEDFASSVSDTADAASDEADALGDAADAAKEYLNPIDEINKMSSTQSSASGSSGTSGTSGTGTGTSAADMFETVDINSWASDLADMFKTAWENADFTEIGKILGRKLNEALGSIDWEKIEETLNKIAKSVATFLNGFIEETDWDLVGETLAKGINVIFSAANTFAKEFDWSKFGEAVGTGINGALKNLDWDLIKETVENIVGGITSFLNSFLKTTDWGLVGESFAQGINTIITAGYTFVSTFDWATLGSSIASFVNGALKTMDLGLAAKTLSDGIKGFLTTITTAIKEIDWKLVGQQVANMLKNIDWVGIATGLFDAGLALISGLLEAFGELPASVQAVATVIAGLWLAMKGYTIISSIASAISAAGGLLPALSSLLGLLGNPIVLAIAAVIAIGILLIANWDKISAAATEIWGAIKDWFESVCEAIGGFFSDLWDGIVKTFKDVGSWFKGKFEAARDAVKAAFTGIGDWFGERYTDITNAMTGAKDWFKSKFDAARTSVNNAFSSIGSWFGSRYTDVKNAFTNVGSWFSSKFSSAYSSATGAFSGVKKFFRDDVWGKIKDVFSGAKDWFGDTFEKALKGITTAFKNVFGAIEGIVKSPINGVIGILNSLISGMEYAVNTVAKMLNSISITIPSWVPGLGGNTWSPNLPTWTAGKIPYLAKGAVIPPNSPFVAMLGDQKSGTNIEAPLDTIKQGVRDVLRETQGNRGNGGTYHFSANINRRTLFDEMMTEAQLRRSQTSRNPFEMA